MNPFAYFEVRPCLQPVDDIHDTISFTDEDEFNQAVANAAANGVEIVTFWTVYGVDAEGNARPIADDIHGKASAHRTMRAMLGPLNAVLDILEDQDRKYRIDEAKKVIQSFIEACSTDDRI